MVQKKPPRAHTHTQAERDALTSQLSEARGALSEAEAAALGSRQAADAADIEGRRLGARLEKAAAAAEANKQRLER